MDNQFEPILKNFLVREPLMWVTDTSTETLLDMTPATAAAESKLSFEPEAFPRTLSREFQLAISRAVVSTGKSHTLIEWMKLYGSWRKLSRIKSHAGGSRVLEISQDITHLDPRAEWLARINLGSQRLEMEDGESISFPELVVLHMLLKGMKHRRIAETLNISTKTVEYRVSRLKNALAEETTEDMMSKVSSSGLIYLAMIPIDLANPARTELELYKNVPG